MTQRTTVRLMGALLIETKVKGNYQSQSQKEWQQQIEKEGYKYVVCRSLDEFQNQVTNYLGKSI